MSERITEAELRGYEGVLAAYPSAAAARAVKRMVSELHRLRGLIASADGKCCAWAEFAEDHKEDCALMIEAIAISNESST